MSTVPTIPNDPGTDLSHPTWCHSGTCTAPDRLLERGVAERDVPMHRRGQHFSPAHVLPIASVSEVELRFELLRDVFQSVTDEVDGALLSYHSEVCGHSGVLTLATEQLAPLATAATSLRDLASPDRNPVVAEVANALRVLGCIDRSNAAALLSLTVVHLTDRERDAVLAEFPAGGSGPWAFGGDR